MSTADYELSQSSWTEILTGPQTNPVRIESAINTSLVREAASQPSASAEGHALKERVSELVTLPEGKSFWARALAGSQTLMVVT